MRPRREASPACQAPGVGQHRELSRNRRRTLDVRNDVNVPRLTVEEILQRADAHFALTGSWPMASSGFVVGMPDETWAALDSALRGGLRGLPSGLSLARLLAAERGVKNKA